MKNLIIASILSLTTLFAGSIIFAQETHEGHQEEIVESEQAEVTEEGPVEVGNMICPVSGEKIEEETAYKLEFEGKIYNLCCKMCAKDFEKDPQKYIETLEEIKEGEEKPIE